MTVGKDVRLTIENNAGVRADITWEVSKEGIVSINGHTIVAQSKGKVTLTAEYQGETFKAVIIVC